MARRADARQPSATPDPPSWLAVPRPEEIYREPECPPSCRCDGVVYTLHFDQPVGPAGAPPRFRAQHYTGTGEFGISEGSLAVHGIEFSELDGLCGALTRTVTTLLGQVVAGGGSMPAACRTRATNALLALV